MEDDIPLLLPYRHALNWEECLCRRQRGQSVGNMRLADDETHVGGVPSGVVCRGQVFNIGSQF